jgi:hypothetical protein
LFFAPRRDDEFVGAIFGGVPVPSYYVMPSRRLLATSFLTSLNAVSVIVLPADDADDRRLLEAA